MVLIELMSSCGISFIVIVIISVYKVEYLLRIVLCWLN